MSDELSSFGEEDDSRRLANSLQEPRRKLGEVTDKPHRDVQIGDCDAILLIPGWAAGVAVLLLRPRVGLYRLP